MLLNAESKPFFSTGCEEFTEEDRQKSYIDYRKMYRARKWNDAHPDYEGRIFGRKEFKRFFTLIINFPGLISRACGDLLFGEPIRLKADRNDEFLQQIKRDSFLDSMLYLNQISNSYRGDAVICGVVTGNVVRAKTVPAYNYYILPDPHDPGKTIAEYIARMFVDSIGRQIVSLTEYTDGRIEEQVWLAHKSDQSIGVFDKECCWKLTERLDFYDVYGEFTDRTEIIQFDPALGRLIQHIPNFLDDERYFGFSDYFDLVTIFDGINNRISNIDAYLDTHSKPKLVGPDEMLDLEGKFDFKADYLPTSSPEMANALKYLVWDGKIESSLNQLKYLESKLFQISEMSPVIFGIDLVTSVDSSMAMRQFFTRTKAKINRKRMIYDERLKRFFWALMNFAAQKKIEGATGCDAIEIFWQDGIPQDYAESVNVEAQRIGAGMSSVRESIMRTDLISEEEADLKIERILKEREMGILPDPNAMNEMTNPVANGGGVNNSENASNTEKKSEANSQPPKTGLRTKG